MSKTRLNVLVLEDDPEDFRLLQRRISSVADWDVELVHVQSIAELADAFAPSHFNVVFIDNLLGRESGLDAIDVIRSNAPYVPVILLTGQGSEEVAKDAIRRGANDYLSKDELSEDTLRWAVESALRETGLREANAEVEARLRKHERLESVTLMASHLAHDYNNLLSAILGYTELCLDQTAADSPMRNDLQQVRSAAMRARDLTKQLLTISRMRVVQTERLAVNDEVRAITSRLADQYGPAYALHSSACSDEDVIQANSEQFTELLELLFDRARQAMPDGGEIRIVTDCVDVGSREAIGLQIRPGRYVTVEVKDDGHSISKELREHIFEPFFDAPLTSGEPSMGLALAYGIARQHEGTIELVNVPQGGSSFIVYFPIEQSVAREPTEPPQSPAPTSAPLVLVVDDEALLCKIIQRTLEPLGYRIETCTSSTEALERVRDGQLHIDLLVTDVVMPDMSGSDLYKEMKSIFPALRVLYVSGFTRGLVEREGLMEQGAVFLQKPFSLQALASYVRLLSPLNS